MKELKGRLAVISGAGSGIGGALAQALVTEGCHVALCDLNDAGLQETLRICGQASTACVTAKFAVRGFSESLIHDFRFNAPHLSVSVVMPGHIGTNIIANSLDVLVREQPDAAYDEDFVLRWRAAYAAAIDT